jgi:hypothetical protein
MQHAPSKPGAPASDPNQPGISTTARARSSLASMQHDSSKPDATGADHNSAAPVYIDDKELERRVPAIRRATWQKMRIEGRGPGVRKIGRRCVYSWPEVVAWLESHRVATRPDAGSES